MNGYVITAVLTVVALVVILIGNRFAGSTSNPRTFRLGSRIAAVGLILLWLLPLGAMALKAAEWSMFLFIGALFIAGSTIAAGLQAMARAATETAESRVDQALDSIIQQNDLR
jgi:Na+/melibiose symporter-like transporter